LNETTDNPPLFHWPIPLSTYLGKMPRKPLVGNFSKKRRDCLLHYTFLWPKSFLLQIPGTEGRAGMVCIQGTPESIDVATMLAGICNNLPSYARPIFFRFADDLDMTGREIEQILFPDLFNSGFGTLVLISKVRIHNDLLPMIWI
jgi:hypothetical protein